MNCPTSYELEAYAIGMHKPDDGIQKHVAFCPACSESLIAYRNYHAIAGSIKEKTLDRLADNIVKESVTTCSLKPVQRTPGDNKLRLAAKSRWHQNHIFVRGFINEKEDIVARLMRDEFSGEFILFLIAPPEKLKQTFLIQVEGIDQKWLSDDSGMIILGKLHASEIVDSVIHLSSPRFAFKMEPLTIHTRKTVASGNFIVQNQAMEKIRISIDDSQESRYYQVHIDQLSGIRSESKVYVSVIQDALRDVRTAVNGIAVFENLDETRTLKIKIY